MPSKERRPPPPSAPRRTRWRFPRPANRCEDRECGPASFRGNPGAERRPMKSPKSDRAARPRPIVVRSAKDAKCPRASRAGLRRAVLWRTRCYGRRATTRLGNLPVPVRYSPTRSRAKPLPIAPRLISNPGRRNATLCRAASNSTHCIPTWSRAAARSASEGTRRGPRKKPHALMSAPAVTSNAPSVSFVIRAARLNRSNRPRSTGTGAAKAVRLSRHTSLLFAVDGELVFELVEQIEGELHRGRGRLCC